MRTNTRALGARIAALPKRLRIPDNLLRGLLLILCGMVPIFFAVLLRLGSADATTWATCGVEHVFFAAHDVNADGFEDVLTVGADRKLYVAPTVQGWKATGWRTVRDQPLPEGVIAFAAIRDESAATTTQAASAASRPANRRSILVLTPDHAQIIAGEKLALVREFAPPSGKTFKGIITSPRQLIEMCDGTVWEIDGGELREAKNAVPTSEPVVAPPTAPPYQPDAKFMKVFDADISGDDLPDRVGVYRMTAYGDYQELRVQVTPNPQSSDSDADGLSDAEERTLGTNPNDRDSDDDGLLDGWEVNGLPRRIDIGAGNKLNPLRQDVICAISIYEPVDRAATEKELARAAELYKAIPTKNPDGSTGLTVHFRYDEKVPLDKQHGGSWQAVGNERLSPRERGMLHWMQITPGGGGQAAQTGDMGGCGAGFAVFTHEFGHQLGLSHTGDSNPAWCPLYPSLMSYAFSYSLGGDGNAIRFSDGRFRETVLLESKLEERLPYPFDDVKYLAAPPFRFKLESDGNGGTRIDWNQNGKFDEGKVSADINYGGSTDCGIRRPLDLIGAGPALAYVGESCWLATLGHDQGAISLQRYLGEEKWSDKLAIPESGTTQEPLIVGTATNGYVLFRRSLGWYAARFTPTPPSTQPAKADAAQSPPAQAPTALAKIDAPVHLPDLPRCDLSAAPVGNRILLIARRDDDALESFWLDYADKPAIKRGQTLEARSVVPVGFAQNPADQRIALVSTAAHNSHGAAQCMRVTWLKVAGDRLVEQETIWTRGEGSGNGCTSRPQVTFDAGGQLNIYHTGGQHGDGSMIVYRTRQIGNRELDEGWLTCMLYDVWTRTRVPVAFANGPQGAIYGFRWDADGWTKNNTLLMGYNGFGLNDEPMRDFNDGEKIAKYGLTHSILWMQD